MGWVFSKHVGNALTLKGVGCTPYVGWSQKAVKGPFTPKSMNAAAQGLAVASSELRGRAGTKSKNPTRVR